MKIGYVEDEVSQAEYLTKRIKEAAKKLGIEISIDNYSSAEEFLFKTDSSIYDLLLLDICMKSMNGMELAKKVRENNKDVEIVFLTSEASYAVEGYEVGALRYCLKPVSNEKIEELLQLAYGKERPLKDYFILKVEKENRRFNKADVVYLEVQGHYVYFNFKNKEVVKIKDSMTNALALINDEKEIIISTHRSYAVNIAFVERISKEECFLGDYGQVPVAKPMYIKINEAFIKYNLNS